MNKDCLQKLLFDKSVLVTGGTGTVGTALVEYILNSSVRPRRLIIFSRDEHKQFLMEKRFPKIKFPFVRYFIGDIRNKSRLLTAFDNVDFVIHTAAMKHVAICEYNPFEAVMTNVLGTQNIVEACISAGVTKAVILGTDKAVGPANFYGATKLCSDKLFTVGNNMAGSRPNKFCVLRCGNLFGSRGSVIPIFADLVLKGETVLPITDARMTRTTMMPKDAAGFVFFCLGDMKGGETYVPKIPSYRVLDVARALQPGGTVKIIGARPGEKLHEVMINSEEAKTCIELDTHFTIYPLSLYQQQMRANPSLKKGYAYSSLNNTEFLTVANLRNLARQVRPELETCQTFLKEFSEPFSFSKMRKCFIIAEAGVNHNGDLQRAKLLVDIAKDCGADAVKFQTFISSDLCTANALQADYQSINTGVQEPQHDMLEKLELPFEAFQALQRYCEKKKIIFFSSPFDSESLKLLVKLNVPIIKIGSGEVTNIPFLQEIGRSGIPVILSTGMSTLDEVERAYNELSSAGCPEISILHCTSNYPAKPEEINLLAMKTLQDYFGVTVGYSDHTIGDTVAMCSIAMGGKILEKHFTYDKNAEGPDHAASASPDELRTYVENVRHVELLLGSGVKEPQKSEILTKKAVAKFVVAKCDVTKGTVLNISMLTCKRGGGGGLLPKDINLAIGKQMTRSIKKDTPISGDFLQDNYNQQTN